MTSQTDETIICTAYIPQTFNDQHLIYIYQHLSGTELLNIVLPVTKLELFQDYIYLQTESDNCLNT
jgi:hypothetical protein